MNFTELNSSEKNIKGVLLTNPLQWIIVDNSAHVKYIVFFTICNFKDGKIIIDEKNQLPVESVQQFEWTNEANCLYLTGRMIISDTENIMPKYYNTFTAINVIIEKYAFEEEESDGTSNELENKTNNNPRKYKERFLNKFDHTFIFDKISIDKQQMRQSKSNHVLIYNVTLKSLHALKLIGFGSFSNWDSNKVIYGNYSTKDQIKYIKSNFENTLGKNFAKNFASKIKSSAIVEKLSDITGKINSTAEKLESAGIKSKDKDKDDEKPIKIYSIIRSILNKSLNDKEEIFKFYNFDEVFGDQHPIIKYCMTKKETILDAVKYLQQKLFSLKLPHRINLNSNLGLTYISYDEFSNNFKVVYFKEINSFRPQYDDEINFDIAQVNGGTMIMSHLRKIPLEINNPKQNKFSGMINYLTNFYHASEYELAENLQSNQVKFSKPSKSNKELDYAENVTKVIRTSNNMLEFMQYDEKFKESPNSEQNIKSLGKDIFFDPEKEESEPYTLVYSEDFDNNSYLKLLDDALFKNVITIKFTGNFFDVPGMIFELLLDSYGGGETNYYSQLNNAIMHITKVTHWMNRSPGLQASDYYLGEELTLCKI